MKREEYFSIPELAEILGLSSSAVYKRVTKGQIKAIRFGRIYAIPKEQISIILGETLSLEDKKEIEQAVKKTVEEYSEVLMLLGHE